MKKKKKKKAPTLDGAALCHRLLHPQSTRSPHVSQTSTDKMSVFLEESIMK